MIQYAEHPAVILCYKFWLREYIFRSLGVVGSINIPAVKSNHLL